MACALIRDVVVPRSSAAARITTLFATSVKNRVAPARRAPAKSHGSRRCSRPQPCRSMMEYMSGSQAEFQEDDEEYSLASVVEAREVRCGPQGFAIKMVDGTLLQCSHSHPEGTRLPTYDSQSAIVLRLEDGSDIFLPIIVLELPSQMVLEAVRNVPLARPTVYMVIRELIDIMGYSLKLVRVTHRVCEAYYARIFLSKAGDDLSPLISLDLRPSDAVNLAVRAKVPIQVNKSLAVTDGVRVVQVHKAPRALPPLTDSPVFHPTEDDRPDEADTLLSQLTGEFSVLRSMVEAAMEERYDDAAKYRDSLLSMCQTEEEPK